MISFSSGDDRLSSNVLSFPVAIARQRKPKLGVQQKGVPRSNVYPLGLDVYDDLAGGEPSSQPNAFSGLVPPLKPARTYRVMPTSEAGRAYLRPRYIKHITAAIVQGNVRRLDALYKRESFKLMPASDKLSIAQAVLMHTKGLRLSSVMTEGLSACFLEAFRRGLGTRRDFRDWLEFTVNRLSLDTLEHLVVAAQVNDDIRSEATELVFECYS
jgi:hypothetical protein